MGSTYFNARGVARPGVPSAPVAGEASNATPVNCTQGKAADAPLRGGIDSFSARDDRPYSNRTERPHPSVRSGAFKPARSAHSSERAAGVRQLSIPDIFEVLRETLTDTEAALLSAAQSRRLTPDEAHALTAAVKDEGRTDRTISLVRRPEVRGLIDYGRQGAALFFWAVMGRQTGEFLHSRFPLLSEQNAAIAGTVVGTLIGNYQENIIDRTVRFFSGEPERFRWMPVIALSDEFGASAPT